MQHIYIHLKTNRGKFEPSLIILSGGSEFGGYGFK